jgi:hypothetical protein
MENILVVALLISNNRTLMMEKIMSKAVPEEINLIVTSILLIHFRGKEVEKKDQK